jgi:uncharacterized protein YwqG
MAMATLSPQERKRLSGLVAKHGLQRVGPRLLELAQPCVHLRPAGEEKRHQVGRTRLGGVPDLPEGVAWPQTKTGLLVFLAQINLEEVPPLDGAPLPEGGML